MRFWTRHSAKLHPGEEGWEEVSLVQLYARFWVVSLLIVTNSSYLKDVQCSRLLCTGFTQCIFALLVTLSIHSTLATIIVDLTTLKLIAAVLSDGLKLIVATTSRSLLWLQRRFIFIYFSLMHLILCISGKVRLPAVLYSAWSPLNSAGSCSDPYFWAYSL